MSGHTQPRARRITPTPERLPFRWLHHNDWKWNEYPGSMSHPKESKNHCGAPTSGIYLTHAQCDHGLTTIAKQRAILQPARLFDGCDHYELPLKFAEYLHNFYSICHRRSSKWAGNQSFAAPNTKQTAAQTQASATTQSRKNSPAQKPL